MDPVHQRNEHVARGQRDKIVRRERRGRPAKALVVTANYRGADPTLDFLSSLHKLKHFSELDVVIVDNSSGDDSISRIREKIVRLGNVRFYESSANRGYFGAAKWGLDRYIEETKALPDWVLVCNNDIVIDDKGFLVKLFDRDPATVGVIAPKISSLLTRLDQNPFMRDRPTKVQLARIRFWFSHYYLMLFRSLMSNPKRHLLSWVRHSTRMGRAMDQDRKPKPIYAPHGAFVIFSRRYFELGGLIDDGVFLYGEEISVAEICRRLGLAVIHDSELFVWHKEHQTSGQRLSRQAYARKQEALRYLISRYLSDV